MPPVQGFKLYEGAPEKLSPDGRDKLAAHAIRQGATEIAGIYGIDVEIVREIVVEYRAKLVRQRQGIA